LLDEAAWVGLVPREDSTGGKRKLGPISKQGDRYLRRILVVGAHAVLRRARQHPEKYPWLTKLLARRPLGQQPKRLHSKAGYMAAPERFAQTSDSSCNAGAVHTWHFSDLGMSDLSPEMGPEADNRVGHCRGCSDLQ